MYQVSNLGRVKSLNFRHTGREQILKPKKQQSGYIVINLYKNSKMKTYKVHRLVSENFIDNPNNYNEINHIDENKENNCVYNLEWCSHSYNINYGTRNRRSGKSLSISIYCLENGTIYKSITECGNVLQLSIGNISSVLNKRRKLTKGYTFRYADQVLYKGDVNND